MSINTPASDDTVYTISLDLLDGDYAVCRFDPEETPPPRKDFRGIYSLTTTHLETSLVCSSDEVPEGAQREPGWRALYVKGPIPFGLTGVVAGITSAVASAGLPVFVLSTYDSDLLFLQSETLQLALDALRTGGYNVSLSQKAVDAG